MRKIFRLPNEVVKFLKTQVAQMAAENEGKFEDLHRNASGYLFHCCPKSLNENTKRTRKLQQKRSGCNGTLRCRQFTGTIILQPFYSTLEQRPTVSLNSTTQKPQVSQNCALKVQNMPKGGKGGSKLRLPDQTGAGWPALQGP